MRDVWHADTEVCWACRTLQHAQMTTRETGTDQVGALWTVRRDDGR